MTVVRCPMMGRLLGLSALLLGLGCGPSNEGGDDDTPRDGAVVGDDARSGGPDASSSGDGGCGALPQAAPYAGHDSNEEFTDPPSCPGCSAAFTGLEELDVASVPAGMTAITIAGRSDGAPACEWYVVGGACGLTHGVAQSDPDRSGGFSATVPIFCGANVIRIVCSNAAGKRVLVRRIQGPLCSRDLRATLTWDSNGRDMELHLIRQGGKLNSSTDDCTWFTCTPAYDLAWGPTPAEHPRKDVDNTQYLGPENIYLDTAPAGTYHLMVEYWGDGETPSTNNVTIAIHEATVATLTRPLLPIHHVWYVGTVAFPAGVFTPVDTVTDCTGSWMQTSRGCDLSLP